MYNLVVRECEKRHPILSSIISYLNREKLDYQVINVKKDIKLLKRITFDGKVIISDPIVGLICKIFGREIDIFFSLELFEHQVPNDKIKNKIRNRIFKYAHLKCLKSSKKVVFPSEARMLHYLKVHNINLPEVVVVPNFPSQAVLKDIKSTKQKPSCFSSFLNDIGVKSADAQILLDKKRYIYPGTLDSNSRGVKELIEYFETKDDCTLILAGPTKNCEFKEFTLEKNVIYLGVLSRVKVLEVMNNCDVGILYYDKNLLNTELCCPVKLFEYLNLGLNVTATCNKGLEEYKSAIENLIVLSEGGISVTNNVDYKEESKERFINKAYEDFLANVI